MFGICEKCWNLLSRPPWLLDGTDDVPMDVVTNLFNQWLTGDINDGEATINLSFLFGRDYERARTYFRNEFVANAISQANGDRVARAGAFARPLPSSFNFASAFGTANARDRGRDPLIPARADLGASVPASGLGRGAGGLGPGGVGQGPGGRFPGGRGPGGRGRGTGGRGPGGRGRGTRGQGTDGRGTGGGGRGLDGQGPGGRGPSGQGPGGRGPSGRGRGTGGRGPGGSGGGRGLEYVPPQLADVRAEMTLEGIKNATRARKTFSKRNGENVSFILWLFDNKPEFLEDQFRQLLQRTDNEIDYSILTRKRYRGKKTIDERKVELRKSSLADVCKSVLKDLSQVGGIELSWTSERIPLTFVHNFQAPTMATVDLEAVANDVAGSFFEYICNRKKQDGGLMMASCYTGYRSAFSFLFKRYGRRISEELKEEISDLMKGVKRIANQARQAGEVSFMSRLIVVFLD